MHEIKIFAPPSFTKVPLDMSLLENITDKVWQYSSFGRVSLFHILKELSIKQILIPIYICPSILEPLKKLGITPLFYDLDKKDLNASLESIKYLSEKYHIKTVLIASMYGNPANLVEIESYCKANDIFLIDDAAQSFGSMLDEKTVGTFGNAGFFSFSPGKPTAGHMGSFFWSDDIIKIKRSGSCLYHYLKWKDFQLNRLHIYDKKRRGLFYNYLVRIYSRFHGSYDDDICEFEEEILGGILKELFDEKFNFRELYQKEFFKRFAINNYFRVVTSLRGTPSSHKLVIIFYDQSQVMKFQRYLYDNHVFSMQGYPLLSSGLTNLPNAKEIEGKIVELPIEEDSAKMKYLFEKVEIFVNN